MWRFGITLSVVVAGCGPPTPLAMGRVGSSIALVGSHIAVVNPDQDSVTLLDPDTLDEIQTIPVGSKSGAEPHALVATSDGRLIVTLHRTGEIQLIDPSGSRSIGPVALCPGASGLALTPDGLNVYVACEWAGNFVELGTSDLRVGADLSPLFLTRPRVVACVGDDVVVGHFTGGAVDRFTNGGNTTTGILPRGPTYRPALTSMTANLITAMVPVDGKILVAHELVNNTGDTTSEKVADDYGSVTDGNPKINPAVTALDPANGFLPFVSLPVIYASFDGGSKVFNGPSAIADAGHGLALVTHISTGNVALIDTNATTVDARVKVTFLTGAGASGVAVDLTRNIAWVDNAFDYSVTRIDLTNKTTMTRVRNLVSPYSPAALAGRKIFHDASNPHITPSGVVACSTCHPAGGDDGLVWFVHTSKIPLKRRRTPNLANSHSQTAPFHWDAQFPDMPTLARSTITDLMAGDDLLVDVNSIQAYIDEIVKAPIPPAGDPNAIARGQALFMSATTQCATCHPPPDFTDRMKHTVLNPNSLTSDDVMPSTDTPALHGLFLRAPYFHDGRSPTLEDLLSRPDAAMHGTTSMLSAQDKTDLLAFLGSL